MQSYEIGHFLIILIGPFNIELLLLTINYILLSEFCLRYLLYKFMSLVFIIKRIIYSF